MADTLPLADVRILDFMWVMAGPASTRILADYGATVIRIESPTRVDTARTLQPFHNNTAGADSSGLFSNCNAGKFGISLDLANPRSREVVQDLLQWAQVVTESFSPKAMRAWGYDYESLRKLKPDLIMLSTCLMGQSGPLSRIAGFGNMAAAISGFHNLTGWPDRPPAGPFGAYTDYVSPRFTALAILAALDHHRRTGEGQYIDQSQAEASLHRDRLRDRCPMAGTMYGDRSQRAGGRSALGHGQGTARQRARNRRRDIKLDHREGCRGGRGAPAVAWRTGTSGAEQRAGRARSTDGPSRAFRRSESLDARQDHRRRTARPSPAHPGPGAGRGAFARRAQSVRTR
jgi:CoA-transferase family III